MGYTDLTARFVYKNPLIWGDLDAFGENDKWLKDNGWADSTKAVFYQASAPTGWTKVVTQNDKMLRVVSGAGGGSGGSFATSSTMSLAHTAHTISTDSNHTHNLTTHSHTFGSSGSQRSSSLSGPKPLQVDGSGLLTFGNGITAGSDTTYEFPFDMDAGPFATDAQGSHNHGGALSSASLTDLTFSYVDVIVCSKDTSSGYTDETNVFAHDNKIDFDPFPTLAANDNFLQPRLTPSGSVSLFFQAAASSGWTKLTTRNDKCLRVVSGTGGGAVTGSQGFGTAITLAHTHSITAGGSHTHTMPNHTHTLRSYNTLTYGSTVLYVSDDGTNLESRGTGGGSTYTCYKNTLASGGTGTSDNPGNHQHTIGSSLSDLSLAYCDVIQCSKDSTGAPTSFADLTATTAWKKLVSKQKLTSYANNDAYMKYHTVPSGSFCYFFQSAAPLNWTKSSANNDKALRVVSGSGGATGGSAGISATVTLAHTHSIANVSHTHSLSHTHSVNTGSKASLVSSANFVFGTLSNQWYYQNGVAGSGFPYVLKSITSDTVTTDTYTHNHGGSTGSLLSNVSLAYIDVICCSKN